jgi:hypothetical protein
VRTSEEELVAAVSPPVSGAEDEHAGTTKRSIKSKTLFLTIRDLLRSWVLREVHLRFGRD